MLPTPAEMMSRQELEAIPILPGIADMSIVMMDPETHEHCLKRVQQPFVALTTVCHVNTGEELWGVGTDRDGNTWRVLVMRFD